MTAEKKPKRVSITHLAMDVIENAVKRYFDLMIENFYNEKSDFNFERKIKLELYEFLVLNDFYIDDIEINKNKNKAIVFIHSLFTDIMKAEFILNVEMIDSVLVITNSEFIGLKRLRKRD